MLKPRPAQAVWWRSGSCARWRSGGRKRTVTRYSHLSARSYSPRQKVFVRRFVDEGPAMAAMLQAAHARGIAPDYITRLLAAFPRTEERELRAESAESIHSVL